MVDMRTDGEMAYSGFGNLEQSYKGHNRVGPRMAAGWWPLAAENKNDNGGSRWKRDGGGGRGSVGLPAA